jgi:AcrR family transcriptional regulator
MATQDRTTVEEPPKRRGPGRPKHDGPSPKFLARQAEIVTAAAKIFREKGYDAGTLDDVGEATGLRGPTLYYYVQSKAHLLYMIFSRTLDVALGELDERLRIEDPRQRLAALIRYQIETVAGEADLFAVFFDNHPRLDPQFEKEIRARERKYLDSFTAAVQAAADAGVIQITDVRYATRAIHTMTTWIYKWFRPGDSAALLAENCISLVLGPETAVRTEPLPATPRRPRSK